MVDAVRNIMYLMIIANVARGVVLFKPRKIMITK